MSKKDFSIAIFITIVWGANYSIVKLGLNGFDPFLLTDLRFLLCAIPGVFLVKRPAVKLRYIALYGIIFGLGLGDFINIAIDLGVSAGMSSLLLQFSAFFTIIGGVVFFKEKIHTIQYAGITASIIGFIIILYYTSGNAALVGNCFMIMSALCWGICNMIIKKERPENMLAFIIWSSLFATPLLFLVTFLIRGSSPFLNFTQQLNKNALFSILFQTYLTTLLGYGIWNILIRKYSASLVAPISLLIPVFGIICSHLMFGEVISVAKIVATALIIAGMLIFIYGNMLNLFLKSRFVKLSKDYDF